MEHEPEQSGEAFIQRFLGAREAQWDGLRGAAADLAVSLRRAAVDLAMSRATEFSHRIPALHLLAAKVGLLAHWPDTSALELYERDILSYRNYDSTREMVDGYERFKADYLSQARSGA